MFLSNSGIGLAVSAMVTMGSVTMSAQDVWEGQVRSQLLALAANVDSRAGYVASHRPFFGWLNDGASTEIQYNLETGVRYFFGGVCDNDCSDLDLKLYDGNHRMIAQDTSADDTPLLTVDVARGGRFYLRVEMANCSTISCRYATQAFRPTR